MVNWTRSQHLILVKLQGQLRACKHIALPPMTSLQHCSPGTYGDVHDVQRAGYVQKLNRRCFSPVVQSPLESCEVHEHSQNFWTNCLVLWGSLCHTPNRGPRGFSRRKIMRHGLILQHNWESNSSFRSRLAQRHLTLCWLPRVLHPFQSLPQTICCIWNLLLASENLLCRYVWEPRQAMSGGENIEVSKTISLCPQMVQDLSFHLHRWIWLSLC